jgi:hypothetical protein
MIKYRKMGGAGHVTLIGAGRGTYRVVVGRPEGKRLLGRHRHRWYIIKMYLQEIGWGCVDWVDLPQVMVKWRVLGNAVMGHRVHKCGELLG